MVKNIEEAQIKKDDLLKALAHYNLKVKDVLLLILTGNTDMYLQPYGKNSICGDFQTAVSDDNEPLEDKDEVKDCKVGENP